MPFRSGLLSIPLFKRIYTEIPCRRRSSLRDLRSLQCLSRGSAITNRTCPRMVEATSSVGRASQRYHRAHRSRLDNILTRHGFLESVIVKIDVQGFELEVLKGASRCLAAIDIFVIECSLTNNYEDGPILPDIMGWMATNKYRPIDIFGGTSGGIRGGQLLEVDLAYVRESSAVADLLLSSRPT